MSFLPPDVSRNLKYETSLYLLYQDGCSLHFKKNIHFSFITSPLERYYPNPKMHQHEGVNCCKP